MHKLYELKEKLLDELEAYAENGKYSKEDVESIKYMASAVDHLCNIMEEMDGGEYSGNMLGGGMSYERGGSRGGRSNASYARGRGRNARRDSMGRYSSEGYSRAENDFMADLRELMDSAPNEQMRQKIQSIMQGM